ncbi:MAG TPA: IS1595 family transposase [Planctomycetota bacterium]|nr:IS1595 family transposase [Planctomycetota bacterium]
MAKGQGKAGQAKSAVVAEIPLACSNEAAAVAFFEARLWKGSPRCPRCASTEVARILSKAGDHGPRFLWRCRGCRKQFTIRVGTVLEDSRIPLMHWAYAFWAACASKKGVSAMQIQRQTGLSYKSALFLMHRIRFAMADDGSKSPKLAGTVEVDETYVGGKPRTREQAERSYHDRKTPVMALVERGGNVRAFPIQRVNSKTLQLALLAHIDQSARIMSDEHTAYPAVARRFDGGHYTVKHSAGEYVRGEVYTNTVEGFFSLLKRGMVGTFHSVSKKHLHRYVSEFQFRYNARKIDDGARTELAIQAARGKKLYYKVAVNG